MQAEKSASSTHLHAWCPHVSEYSVVQIAASLVIEQKEKERHQMSIKYTILKSPLP